MNIFVVDQDPVVCAQALDDLRLNKMIIETAQLLSTAMRYYGYTGNDIYKSTHINHPCAVWARMTTSNYKWLYSYLEALGDEYYMRRCKVHKTISDLRNPLIFGYGLMPSGYLTTFTNCSLYKDQDVFEAYKSTLINKWNNDKYTPKWTNTSKPTWYIYE
jgi:hypothetical protein